VFQASAALGLPSPEAMMRLQAAVAYSSTGVSQQNVNQGRARFGINSLIARMAGSPSESDGDASSNEKDEDIALPEPVEDADEEKIEIPSFLKRQAN